MTPEPGWQQPPVTPARRTPKCLHMGAFFASLTLGLHPEGHEWVCVCGQVFVVVSNGEGKRLAPRKGGS